MPSACIKEMFVSTPMKHCIFAFFLCFTTALCDIVIRPSDHLLMGTDYHLHSRRAENIKPESGRIPDRLIHHITLPNEVPIDQGYENDFWGTVKFPPVPEFSIDTHDPVSQDVYISASVHNGLKPWDDYVWFRLVSLLKGATPGHTPVVVDVGANLGYFSLAAASLGAHVIAIEPMSRNARKLAKSILKNKFEDKISLYQNIMWDEGSTGPLMLHATSASNQGNGQVLDGKSGNQGGVYGVGYANAVPLSYIVREDVDVLKIDAEGSESVVIAGAKRLICTFTVKHILMEFTDVKKRVGKYSAVEMLKFLDSVGYIVSDVALHAPPLPVSDYESFPPNILFTLKGDRPVCV